MPPQSHLFCKLRAPPPSPKLIPFSHGNMLAAAARVQSWFGLTPADRCLSVSPVCYSHGLKVTVFTPLITGGSVAFPRSPSSLDVDEWLGALSPTWYSAGPTLHRFMLDKTKPLSNVRSIHGLRFVVSGGAPLTREVREGLAEHVGCARSRALWLERSGADFIQPAAAGTVQARDLRHSRKGFGQDRRGERTRGFRRRARRDPARQGRP